MIPVDNNGGVAAVGYTAVIRGQEIWGLILLSVVQHDTGTGQIAIQGVDAD